MSGYEIVDFEIVDKNITFIRINPTDIKITLRSVFTSLSDLSWISQFDKDYIKAGFRQRAEATISYIAEKIILNESDSITSDSGEYVVSELARMAVVNRLNYSDIPLADLFKIKDVLNHGFDFYSKNLNRIILFGEAKYLSRDAAYGSCFKQIVRFEGIDKQDCSDIVDVDKFFCEESKDNFHKGSKGFIAAFSCKLTKTDDLIKSIKKNNDFNQLKKFDELICVAVNL